MSDSPSPKLYFSRITARAHGWFHGLSSKALIGFLVAFILVHIGIYLQAIRSAAPDLRLPGLLMALVYLSLAVALFFGLICRYLGSRWALLVLALDAIIATANAGIAKYNHELIGIDAMLANLSEVAQSGPAIYQHASIVFLFFYTLTGVLVILFSQKVMGSADRPKGRLRRVALFYLLISCGLHAVFPFKWSSRITSYGKLTIRFGYFTTNGLNLFLNHGTYRSAVSLQDEILETDQQVPPLTPPLTLQSRYDKTLIIQIESLDSQVLGYLHGGQEVTPFLNQLARQTPPFPTIPNRSLSSGSSGADFQVLTGHRPPGTSPAFKYKNLGFQDSLPSSFKSAGIPFFAYHGNNEAFWGRGQAYRTMGMERYFDLRSYPRTLSSWGIDDQNFLQGTAQLIAARTGKGPSAHLIITMSSHTPFNLVKPAFIPAPSSPTEAYLDSLHFTDQALKDFFSALQGPFLVVIYGDHESGLAQTYAPGRPNPSVPVFIFEWHGGLARPAVDVPSTGSLNRELHLTDLNTLLTTVPSLWKTPSNQH